MPAKTPFFHAFGPLLFGRRARKVVDQVKQLRSLGEIYELFGEMLPEGLLGLNAGGVNSRARVLTPEMTFWAFVSQVFDVGSACRDAARKVEAWWRWSQKEPPATAESLTASAYCQARKRLDHQTLRVRHFASAVHAARRNPKQQEVLIEQMLAIIAGDPVPERPGRAEPPTKKRRAKNYHLLTNPRHEMRLPSHRNRPRISSPE